MIRYATLNDIDKIMAIEKEIFGKTLGYDFYKNDLVLPFSNTLLYLINSDVVGFITYRNIDNKVDILNIGIIKSYQHQGFGRQLINFILTKEQPQSIILEVSSTNTQAIKFYEGLGFKKISIRKGYYNGVDGFVYFYEVSQ